MIKPSKVFLFSGHMIDRPDREVPRFPAVAEGVAANAIRRALIEFCARPADLGICGGACGGDILFAEACIELGMTVHLFIQFEEHAFLDASVRFAEGNWEQRYFDLKANPLCQVFVQSIELGPAGGGENVYRRNNLWQLDTALSYGAENVRFLAFWNGEGGDGPGGTKDMIDIVNSKGGKAVILRTTDLW